MKKLATCFAIVICVCCSVSSFATTYYVSYSSGSDSYTGTSLAAQFKTITKAVSVSVAGDIIYLRGETHSYTAKISISKIGTAANRFTMMAYPGDANRPVINFTGQAVGTRGIELSGNYWYMKGFDICKSGDNGMHISGAYNIIEFCAFYENGDTGLQLANGANNNQMINCDSYYNIDASEGNADGFAVKLDVGTGNSFRGCRAWQNSDDGWDGLLTAGLGTNPATTYDSCWCFLNGYRKNMTASVGNGNGFKMGGNNELHDATLRNCLSVYNRVKGFDQNNNNGSMTLYNCTAYKNGRNFGMNNNAPSAGEVMTIKNCVSYLTISSDVFYSGSTRTNNSWQGFTVDASDFVSLDTSVLRGPRNANGSLPNITLLKLAQGSDLIDGGVNVGLPYYGANPDVSYYESNYPMPVEMLSFTGTVKNGTVELSWKTATEIQNTGWEVERYTPGSIAWQKIGFVQGKGNSTSISEYKFSDLNLVNTETVQYRLKQVDKDGNYRYSNIITIRFSKNAGVRLNVFPNPSKDNTTAGLYLDAPAEVSASIFNSVGQFVKSASLGMLAKGDHTVKVNTAGLVSGQYYIRLNANETVYTGSFIKVN
jgi:hypothetical protein